MLNTCYDLFLFFIMTTIIMKSDSVLLAWLSSFRLRTLPLAVSAIFVGNALAYWQKTFSWPVFILTIITASLLQILSNLANDYGDGLKGSDNIDRIGPKRGIHQGNITLKQLHIGLIINTILCISFGLGLLFLACDNILQIIGFISIGLLSIVAAVTYTVGKNPYGYIGLGDVSVLVFFGLVSIFGSFYLQTKFVTGWLLLPAFGCGLLSVAVLNINNLRDYYNDKANNKKTLVVIIGYQLAKYYHIALLISSFILLSLFSSYYLKSYYSFLFLLTLPLFYRHLYAIYNTTEQNRFALQFLPMIKLALLVNLLYSIGIILS